MNPQQNQASSPQPQTPPSMGQFPNTHASQDPTQGANQAAASLAFATHLQTQMMQHQAPPKPSPTSPQNAPGQEQNQNTTDTKDTDISKELTDFKKEIEGMITSQIGDLKREIQTALSDEQEPNAENQ